MSKKGLVLWLIAIFMYAWILSASAQVNVSVSGPKQVAQGELLIANVDVSEVSNLDTVFIILTYDASVLQATQIMAGNLTASANPVTNTQISGQVRILINLPGVDGASGSGSIAQIEFKVIGAEGSFSELELSEVSLGSIFAESIPAQPASPLRIAVGSEALVDIKLVAPGTAAEGDLVTITLESGQVRDLDAVFAVFEYDQTVLQYVDARKGVLTEDGTLIINANTSGEVRIVMNLPGVDGISGSGSLIELDFTVVGEPGSSSSLSLSEVTLGDVNALEIPIKQPLSVGLEVTEVVSMLDSIPPEEPNVTSSSHEANVPSKKTTIEVSWENPADQGEIISGVDGYSVLWDTESNTQVSSMKELEAEEVNTSTKLAETDGWYYFHIRVVDKAGNWSDTFHFGPFIVDTTPPAIKGVAIEGKPLRVGDEIIIIMSGEPHGKARFSLGGVAQDVSMEEALEGVYRGSYTVEAGVAREKVTLTVALTDEAGNEAKDESQKVFLLAVDDSGKLLVTWGEIKQTKLFQNYPNPFNPDTWIPYQLAEDADLVIRIHDAGGRIILTLDLGHKPAGFYMTKDKAAYWDGRNESGEGVVSGVYFYTIQAGEFTATKKMIMAK